LKRILEENQDKGFKIINYNKSIKIKNILNLVRNKKYKVTSSLFIWSSIMTKEWKEVDFRYNFKVILLDEEVEHFYFLEFTHV
jgi:hypothetical protein